MLSNIYIFSEIFKLQFLSFFLKDSNIDETFGAATVITTHDNSLIPYL